jgi:hypothetical protein
MKTVAQELQDRRPSGQFMNHFSLVFEEKCGIIYGTCTSE